jgi:hypothetical protein
MLTTKAADEVAAEARGIDEGISASRAVATRATERVSERCMRFVATRLGPVIQRKKIKNTSHLNRITTANAHH